MNETHQDSAPPTFASAYDPKRNNFDFIRFMFATSVIWSHCFPLSGRSMDWIYATSGQIDGGSLAVDGFFILSGFLIAQSWTNCPSIPIFARKRLLRIGPALLVALAFGALVIGPLNSTLPVGTYFASRDTWNHFIGVLLYRYLSLSKVFVSNPVSHVLNAPLWSLRYEILCYAGVAMLGLTRSSGWRVSIVAAFGMSWLYLLVSRPIDDARFSAGMLFYLFRAHVPYRRWLAGASGLVLFVTFLTSGFHSMFPVAGGYLLLYAAFSPALPFSRFGRYGDFSYGLYVFAYPIQQTIVCVLGSDMSVLVFFGISFVTTLVLAVLSWHLIEAPALSLKPRTSAGRTDARSRMTLGADVPQAVTLHASGRNL